MRRSGEMLFTGGVTAVLALGLTACGSENEERQNAGATASESADRCEQPAPSERRNAPLEADFAVAQDWSSLEERAPQEDVPCQKTLEECEAAFWRDREGERGPLVRENPPVVIIDGSCNEPLDSDEVGGYAVTRQDSSQLVAVLHNGDLFGIECIETGDPIQDERGPSSVSDVWLGGVAIFEGEPVRMLVPEANAGYVDEEALNLPGCN